MPDAPDETRPDAGEYSYTLLQSLATPALWIAMFGCSAFNLIWSGLVLFNESLLAEHGLDKDFSVQILSILAGTGLLANLVCGALSTRARVMKLLGVGLFILAAGMIALPEIGGANGARIYGAALGFGGGVVTVVFFAAWRHLFGRAHLGRIQAAAQVATVFGSAVGPVLVAEMRSGTGSYASFFYALAAVVAAIAIAALLAPIPPEIRESNHAPTAY